VERAEWRAKGEEGKFPISTPISISKFAILFSRLTSSKPPENSSEKS
jgi:hypothetical protein